jgi:hypothetical protein
MTIDQVEKEIVKALTINSNVDWNAAEVPANEEFKSLIKFVKQLINEYKNN